MDRLSQPENEADKENDDALLFLLAHGSESLVLLFDELGREGCGRLLGLADHGAEEIGENDADHEPGPECGEPVAPGELHAAHEADHQCNVCRAGHEGAAEVVCRHKACRPDAERGLAAGLDAACLADLCGEGGQNAGLCQRAGDQRSGDKAGNEHCGDLTSVSSGELGYDPESDSLKEAAVIQTDRQGEDAYYQPYGARTELRHNLAYSADLEYYEKCEHGKTCCPVGKSGRDEKYQHQTEYTEILPCGAGHGFCFCGDKSNNEHYCDRSRTKSNFFLTSLDIRDPPFFSFVIGF